MSLKIELRQERRRENDNYGKIYGYAKNAAPIGISELAQHMADHGSAFSRGTIMAVLDDMALCIRHLVLDGQPVKIPNVGILSARVTSTPANTPKDFSLADNITCLRLHMQSSGDMTRAELTKDGQLEYTSLANKVREGKVEISTLYDEEDDDDTPSGGGDGGDDGEPDPVRP